MISHLEEILPHLSLLNFKIPTIDYDGQLLMEDKIRSIDIPDRDEPDIPKEEISPLKDLTSLNELRLIKFTEPDVSCFPNLNQITVWDRYTQVAPPLQLTKYLNQNN